MATMYEDDQEQEYERPCTPILDKAIAERSINILYSKPCLSELAMDATIFPTVKGRIKEAFQTDVDLNELRRAIKERSNQDSIWGDGGGKKAAVTHVAEQWANQNKHLWAYDDESEKYLKYNGTHWEVQKTKKELKLEAEDALTQFGIDINGMGTINVFFYYLSAHLSREFVQPKGMINFANGTLVIENGKPILREHRREDGLTSCLPYEYLIGGTYPNIATYMNEAIPDGMGQRATMTHLGLSLLKDMSMHNSLFGIGKPRAGKSTWLALFNAAHGVAKHHSFAGKSLLIDDLEGKRSRATWGKKSVVCTDELPSNAIRKSEEMLKNMSAHSGAESRGINQNEDGDNEWVPKLVLASNDMPQLRDDAGGLKERLIFISFPNHREPKEQDKFLLEEKLIPELPFFIPYCIEEALLTLHNREYPMSDAMRALSNKVSIAGSTLKTFLAERTVVRAGGRVENTRLYDAYVAYCRRNGNHPLSKSDMKKTIAGMYIDGVRCDVSVRDETEPVYAQDGTILTPGKEILGHGFRGLHLLTHKERQERLLAEADEDDADL